ncbi:MAG: hypothetical protein P4M11_02570, partial [Candidatus Pacebacteria bacterium]|nr:hypothetical protein [Candidatus Paceibacterota bacterium]
MGIAVTKLTSLATYAYSQAVNCCCTYPTVSGSSNLSAYLRSLNRRAPAALCVYIAGISVAQVFRLLACIFYGTAIWPMLVTFAMFHLIHISSTMYSFRLRAEASRPENRDNLEAQRSIRSRQLIISAGSFAGLCICAIIMITNNSEPFELVWTITFLLNVFTLMWLSDSVLWKLLQLIGFNVYFCTIARLHGIIKETYIIHMLLPCILASAVVLEHDRETKHNFLLRRQLKEQKILYESFLRRLLDPVLMLDRECGVIFANAAATREVGNRTEEFYANARRAVSETGESLEACVKARLLYPEISRDAIKQERYRVRDEADPQRE